MSLRSWGQQVRDGVQARDGAALARVLSLQTSATRRCLGAVADADAEVRDGALTQLEPLARQLRAAGVPAAWVDVAAPHARAGALLFGAAAKARAPPDSWHLAAEAAHATLRYVAG